MTTSTLVGREQMRWDGMVDHSGESGGKVVRGDVGCWKVMWVVGWYVCSV